MSYYRLMRDHVAIDTMIEELLRLTRGKRRAGAASLVLEQLATVVRDHCATEDAVLAATMDAAFGDRHAVAAVKAMVELEAVEEEWSGFLYRWNPVAVERAWAVFAVDAANVLPRIQARLAKETGILYSLAVHYGQLATTD